MTSRLSSLLRGTIRDTKGQSLIEYSLLLGFLGLVVAGFAFQSGTSVQGIANTAGTTLTAANSGLGSAGSSSPGGDTGTGGGSHDGGHGDGGHDRH